MSEKESNQVETSKEVKKPILSRPVNIVIVILALVRTGVDMWYWIINPGLFSLQLVIVTALTVFIVACVQHWVVAFILVKSYRFINKKTVGKLT